MLDCEGRNVRPVSSFTLGLPLTENELLDPIEGVDVGDGVVAQPINNLQHDGNTWETSHSVRTTSGQTG